MLPSYYRYSVLASKKAAEAPNEKKASDAILDAIKLDSEKYRMGHTKACQNIIKLIRL